MADPKFFNCHGPFTANELAEIAGAELQGDGDKPYQDVAALDKATVDNISFLDNRKYIQAFRDSEAGLCIVHPDLAGQAPEGMDLLLSKEPYMAYAKIANAFYPIETPKGNISERANIAPSATIGNGTTVEAGAYIAADVVIGERCLIKANCVIEKGVSIGNDCIIGSNVTVTHAQVGNAVTIQSGSQIGQEGFGFASGPQGHVRIPQLGRVIIGDHVNVGANVTIDRGAGPDTVIGAGSQIDNLVQIGHNVQIGMGCVLVSQAGISGSTKLGNFVVAAGKAGIAGHLEIGDGVTIAAKAGVMRNIESGQTVGGFPAIPQKDWLRQVSAISKLAKNKKV